MSYKNRKELSDDVLEGVAGGTVTVNLSTKEVTNDTTGASMGIPSGYAPLDVYKWVNKYWKACTGTEAEKDAATYSALADIFSNNGSLET